MRVITVARKPVQGTVASNALVYGTGGINIDGCRIGESFVSAGGSNFDAWRAGEGRVDRPSIHKQSQPQVKSGRWPANLILNEACAEALDDQSGILKSGAMDSMAKGGEFSTYGKQYVRRVVNPASEGGASRFFKVVKS